MSPYQKRSGVNFFTPLLFCKSTWCAGSRCPDPGRFQLFTGGKVRVKVLPRPGSLSSSTRAPR